MTMPAVGTIGVTPTFGNNFDRFVARSIQWFTATRDSYSGKWTGAPVNHAVVFVGAIAGSTKPQLVQANPGGASFDDWDAYGDSMIWLDNIDQVGTTVARKNLVPTDAQRDAIAAFAKDAAIKKIGYNYLDFVAIAIAQKRFGNHEGWASKQWWVKRLSRDNRMICSQLADAAWRSAGLQIFADNRPDGLVSPEDLYVAGGAPTNG